MKLEEKATLEAAKAAAKAGINMRTDLTAYQKAAAMQQVENAGDQTEAIIELCRLLGIKL